MLNRRHFLRATALTASALAAPSILRAQDNRLVINSFGGAYEEIHRRLVITPFEEMTGTKVEVVTAYSADTLSQLRAQKEAPQFDVAHFFRRAGDDSGTRRPAVSHRTLGTLQS